MQNSSKISDLFFTFFLGDVTVPNNEKVKKGQHLKTSVDLENEYFGKIQTPSELYVANNFDGV